MGHRFDKPTPLLDPDPLAARLRPVLDDRLDGPPDAPIAVALSGGGDSLALLLLVDGWARARGRRLVVLTVDHALQPASAAWAGACAALSARFGWPHRTLTWTGPKPASGLPAAARAARHRLLAEAARQAGAHVLLLGHTADDLIEAATMRAAGSTVPDPRLWTPSPAWPEGRDLFLLRPLLEERRAELRIWLANRGESWIEDPANEDQAFARARARAAFNKIPRIPAQAGTHATEPRPVDPDPRRDERLLGAGGLTLPRSSSPQNLAAALLCAAGTTRPPRGDRLAALQDRIARGERFTATLAGARLEAGDRLTLLREPGELTRRPIAPEPLSQNGATVFDGRFELTALVPGLTVLPLAGHARRLPRAEQAALQTLPPAARKALPIVTDGDNRWTCPILADSRIVRVRTLVEDRFRAAIGEVQREADVAKAFTATYLGSDQGSGPLKS